MSGGKVRDRTDRPTSDEILTGLGAALMRYRLRSGHSQQALAEKLGREDRKSVGGWENGTSEMGSVPLLLSLWSLDAEYRGDVMALVGGAWIDLNADGSDLQATAPGVGRFLADMLAYLRDGQLCHADEGKLWDVIEPVMPELISLGERVRARRM